MKRSDSQNIFRYTNLLHYLTKTQITDAEKAEIRGFNHVKGQTHESIRASNPKSWYTALAQYLNGIKGKGKGILIHESDHVRIKLNEQTKFQI